VEEGPYNDRADNINKWKQGLTVAGLTTSLSGSRAMAGLTTSLNGSRALQWQD
jgi:hypothetical protein